MRAALHVGFCFFIIMFGIFLPNGNMALLEVEAAGEHELPSSEREIGEYSFAQRKSPRQSEEPRWQQPRTIKPVKIAALGQNFRINQRCSSLPQHSLQFQHSVLRI